MEYTKLGNTDIKVSKLCMGCMSFGDPASNMHHWTLNPQETEKIIKKSGKFGPVIGALLGIVPQCGFSAIAANFYAARIITRGTLIAIFLSTTNPST